MMKTFLKVLCGMALLGIAFYLFAFVQARNLHRTLSLSEKEIYMLQSDIVVARNTLGNAVSKTKLHHYDEFRLGLEKIRQEKTGHHFADTSSVQTQFHWNQFTMSHLSGLSSENQSRYDSLSRIVNQKITAYNDSVSNLNIRRINMLYTLIYRREKVHGFHKLPIYFNEENKNPEQARQEAYQVFREIEKRKGMN